jgi:hypothetical protein
MRSMPPLSRSVAGALLFVLAACSPSEAPRGRAVTAAWALTADSGATGGAYLTIVNSDSVAVELVGAASPFATSVEVHESMQHDGMSHMMPKASVAIGARDSVVMTPGGLHVMLNQLTRALTAGDSVPLTLRFSNGDSVLVNVPVRAP